MSREDIERRLALLIRETLGIDPDVQAPASATGDPTPATKPFAERSFDDLGFDSLDKVEFVMGIEDEFGIEVPDGEWEPWSTIREAIDLVESKGVPA